MIFAHPRMLWLLLVTLPLLTWFLWWAWRKKQTLIAQFVQSRLLAHLTVGVSRTIQKLRLALLVAAVVCLFLTLAQPQWGFDWEETKQRGRDIIVGIDTSRSMLAQDLAPNRLARAKLAALDLMRLARYDRLGLVAFAGTAFLQCPLTLDDEAFRQSVNTLEVGIIPQGGTALAEAIQAVLSTFKDEGDNHKVLVLFTDGEDHEPGTLEAVEKAAQAGLRIFTIGVGTPNGELLPQRDEKGATSFVKDDQGNPVKSRLNETLLRQIATTGGGFYLPLSGAKTMDILYERGLAPLPTSEGSTKLTKRFLDRFQWPLALAILLLLAEMFLPDRRRVAAKEPSAVAAGRDLQKALAIIALALLPLSSLASSAKALRRYEAGDYQAAQQEYQRLLGQNPTDARLHYNAGTAAYQAKQFEQAVTNFSTALSSPGETDLLQRSYYNLGNTLYRIGDEEADPAKKMAGWEQAIKQYESALKLNAQDADARFNHDLVQKKLEELKKQQQQSQQQEQKQDEQKKDDQKDQDQKQSQQEQKQDQSKDQPQSDQDQKQQDKQEQKPSPQDSQSQNQQQQQQQQQQDKEQQKAESPGQQEEKEQPEKPQEKPSAQPGDKSEEEADKNARAAALGQMTPQQARQLLDAQKNDEKALIFLPQEKRASRNRIFRDW